MSEESIDYGARIQEALRAMVREVLRDVARDGFPGEHHAYLTFRTDAPENDVPPELRHLHPETLTVILQNQYWDLEVTDERVAVTLAFGGRQHRLGISFRSLIGYADPAAELELRFAPQESAAPAADQPSEEPPRATGGQVVEMDRFRRDR